MKIGFNVHRLREDDPYYKDEITIVSILNQDLELSPNLIADILGKSYTTEHEDRVFLTVLQWLGTPVGKDFLNRVYDLKLI